MKTRSPRTRPTLAKPPSRAARLAGLLLVAALPLPAAGQLIVPAGTTRTLGPGNAVTGTAGIEGTANPPFFFGLDGGVGAIVSGTLNIDGGSVAGGRGGTAPTRLRAPSTTAATGPRAASGCRCSPAGP